MKWVDTRERLPQLDQEYVVSVTNGNYKFMAVAYFEGGQWFYSVRGEKGDEIAEQINGWIDNLEIYTR